MAPLPKLHLCLGRGVDFLDIPFSFSLRRGIISDGRDTVPERGKRSWHWNCRGDYILSKKNLLSAIRIGHRVAEDEKNELANYFVKTSQWNKLANGEIDIIYGAKGTGKSALYSLLTNNAAEFLDRKILLVPAENPLGASAFQDLIDDNASNEADLNYIWKLYILQLISAELRKASIASDVASKLIAALEVAGLLPRSFTLASLFARAKNYIQSFADNNPTDIEYTIGLDPISGMPTATRKASYGTSDTKARLSSGLFG